MTEKKSSYCHFPEEGNQFNGLPCKKNYLKNKKIKKK